MKEIFTPRMRLRAFVPEDRDAVVALDGDPMVRRYLHGMPPTRPEEAEAMIARVNREYPQGAHRGIWAAEMEGRFIGWFHLRPARDTGECELGYRLVQEVWGQGLAPEGSRQLVEMAFAEGEPRVIARTLVDNLPSRRVMEKIGMVPVRQYLYEDTVPAIEYALER
ncbi:MAG: GNAT family N-acetyltransferase [Fimbriimonas sp.]